MNSIRKKLTLALLGTSFLAIAAVGITARFVMLRHFDHLVVDRAFEAFQQDILSYYRHFGSWETARAGEPFGEFVARNRGPAPRSAGPGVDHFKDINDRHSHAAGDAVLRGVADILRGSFRAADVVARYGGEEFAVVFPETALEQVAPLAERLRRSMRKHDWASVAPGLGVTVSIGLSARDGDDSLEAVLQSADAKLYESKNAGRDRVSW